MNKSLLCAVIAAAALGVSGLASAGAPGRTSMPVASGNWYIGAGLSYNAIQTDEHAFPNSRHVHTLRLHENEWGYNIFVGQHLNGWFAHELGLNLIGNSSWKAAANDPESSSSALYKIHDIYHIYYDGYFIKPITKCFSVFAKGGLSYLTVKNHGAFDEIDNMQDHRVDDQDQDTRLIRTFGINYGFGVQYDWRQFGFRAQYTRLSPSHDVADWYGMTDLVNLEVLWNLK